MMKKQTRILALVLLLALGVTALAATVFQVQANEGGFRLTWSGFSAGGTGAEPLHSASFQMRASFGETGPVGNAESESFGLSTEDGAVGGSGSTWRIYLPLLAKP
jgi:hypothetical protein